MNEKFQESAQYLKSCSNIETEAYNLYDTLSKKINEPESSFILGLAYDSLKCAKIIQGILEHLDLTELTSVYSKKTLTEIAQETAILNKKISKTNNLYYQLTVEVLKELIQLEDLLVDAYNGFLQSPGPKMIADEYSGVVYISGTNVKKIVESFVEQKTKHREILIEIIYGVEAKQAEIIRQITPVVKYQNPDAWIRESTLHAYSNRPTNIATA
jgi:hypothetical protein